MKTKIEIIKEVMEGYIKDPSTRALDGSSCKYITNDGRKCAVGKCLRKGEWQYFEGKANGLIDNYTENILKTAFRGHSRYFWQDLQWLHDISSNWTDTGLSEVGTREYNRLLNEYNEA